MAAKDGAQARSFTSSALPLAYYFVAHAGLGAALLVLAIDPSLPGGSFYQPRFVSLVHLLTLPWLTGSILGSLYIVGPLALRVPMRVTRADWLAFGSFVFGASGMIAHFWINTYDGMAWSALFVTGAVVHVGVRVIRGMRGSPIQPGVRLHVQLAFVNIAAAAALGMVLGFDRSRGVLAVPPVATMFAHAHVAAVGWVTMLVIGLSYRLVPMMLPAAMPTGRSTALSAILLEGGVMTLAIALTMNWDGAWVGTSMIVGGIMSFGMHLHWMLAHRLRRPPALPARDWSMWQTQIAFAWLIVAATIGLVLSVGVGDEDRLPLMWMYGTAGLLGFLAQMVAGMQGRLVPFCAWYHAYAASGAPPAIAAHALLSPRFARAIFLSWTAAVPMLVWGFSHGDHVTIRAGAVLLLAGVVLGGTHLTCMVRRVTMASPSTRRSATRSRY